MSSSEPIIDLEKYLKGSKSQKLSISKELVSKLRNCGYVHLKNIGISNEKIQSLIETQKKLFELPLEKKLTLKKNDRMYSGYVELGEEKLALDRNGDLREQFFVDNSHTPFPNNDIKNLRPISLEVLTQSNDLCCQILKSIALGLDIDEDLFSSVLNNNDNALSLSHFPPIVSQNKVNQKQNKNREQGNQNQSKNQEQGNHNQIKNRKQGNQNQNKNQEQGNQHKDKNQEQGNRNQNKNQEQGNQHKDKNQEQGNQAQGKQEQGNQEQGNQAQGNQERGNQQRGNQERGNQERGNQEQGCNSNQIRCGEHTAYGALSLIFREQNKVSHLEIRNPQNNMVKVPVIPESVVLTIGDCIELWTNGYLRATTHRFNNPTNENEKKNSEYTVVFYSDPILDTDLKCFDKFKDINTYLPKSKAQTFKEHVDRKFTETFQRKAQDERLN